MKKTIIFVLILLFSLSFISCSLFRGANDIEYLEADEFFIYENEEVVLDYDDLVHSEFDLRDEIKVDYKGRKLETIRGIRIGSEADALAQEYNNVLCAVSSGKITEKSVDFNEFIESNNKILNYDIYYVYYTMFYIDDKSCSEKEFYDYLHESDIDVKKPIDTWKSKLKDIKPFGYYSLLFTIQNNKVFNIRIRNVDSRKNE